MAKQDDPKQNQGQDQEQQTKRGIVQALDDEAKALLHEAHDLIAHIQVKNPYIEQWLTRARAKLGL
jgi:hypothetical protein